MKPEKTIGHFPISLRWFATTDCNLNCTHCFFRNGNLRSSSTMSEREFFDLVDHTRPIRNINAVQILGGEPFVRKDIMQILMGLSKRKIPVSLITNGTAIPDEFYTCLNELSVFELVFSIDGASDEIYSKIRGNNHFDDAIDNLLRYRERKKNSKLKVNYVLTKVNSAFPAKIVNYFQNLSVDVLDFNFFEERGNGAINKETLRISNREKLDFVESVYSYGPTGKMKIQFPLHPLVLKYLSLRHKVSAPMEFRGCTAIVREVLILADGRVSPCASFINKKWVQKALGFSLLSVQEKCLPDILMSPEYDRFIKSRYPKSYKDYYPCQSCEYLGNWCNPCFFESYCGRPFVADLCKEAVRRMPSVIRKSGMETIGATGCL